MCIRDRRPLPDLRGSLRGGATPAIRVRSSERPVQVKVWSASNPQARDFRFACGIRYTATAVSWKRGAVTVPVQVPEAGWRAYFVEATYADGFVATSQTYVLGKQDYPTQAPPSDNAACRTLPAVAPPPAT